MSRSFKKYSAYSRDSFKKWRTAYNRVLRRTNKTRLQTDLNEENLRDVLDVSEIWDSPFGANFSRVPLKESGDWTWYEDEIQWEWDWTKQDIEKCRRK